MVTFYFYSVSHIHINFSYTERLQKQKSMFSCEKGKKSYRSNHKMLNTLIYINIVSEVSRQLICCSSGSAAHQRGLSCSK